MKNDVRSVRSTLIFLLIFWKEAAAAEDSLSEHNYASEEGEGVGEDHRLGMLECGQDFHHGEVSVCEFISLSWVIYLHRN